MGAGSRSSDCSAEASMEVSDDPASLLSWELTLPSSYRYSRRHEQEAQRGESLRSSVARVSIAVEKERREDYDLESESGGSTCSSSHPSTPLTASPPVSWVNTHKPLPAEPFESLEAIRR